MKPRKALVVEDEVLVSMDVAEALRDDGVETLQAYTAEEALAVLEARSDICVVFTDVNLPGKIDGIALASEIQRRWPRIELLMTSGNRELQLVGPNPVIPCGRFVPKPYGAEAVARRIHHIIDAQAH